MANYILVGLGGALGAILRYSTSTLFNYFFYSSFIGTLIANIVGSFLIGFFISIFHYKIFSENIINYFFIIGLLGSYTTFSTFSHETIDLFLNNQLATALIYVILSVFLCIGFAYLGLNFYKIIN